MAGRRPSGAIIIACNGPNSKLAAAIGGEWEGKLTLAAYVIASALAFVSAWLAIALYFAIALSWFIPDRRIEAIMSWRDNRDL